MKTCSCGWSTDNEDIKFCQECGKPFSTQNTLTIEEINSMNDKQIMQETLKKLCVNKDDVKKLKLSPIFIQMSYDNLMYDLAEFGGWKFQEPKFGASWIRIINERGTCMAWGNKQKMINVCKNYLMNS